MKIPTAICTPLLAGLLVFALGACTTSSSSTASAAAPAMAAPTVAAPAVVAKVSFDDKVKPFFAQYCMQCHGAVAPKARVHFDTKAGILARVRPGAPDSSQAFREMASGSMPPRNQKQPTPDEVALIKQWITEGANISDSYPSGAAVAAGNG